MAGQGGKAPKGLPKRTRNVHKKETRAASWRRGQKRKEQRRAAQAEREAANRLRRASGVPTPWEQANGRKKEAS